MPEGIEDETMAAIHFAEGFEQRYGPCHPTFFPGSLDDAMKEACHQPARDVCIQTSYYFPTIFNRSFGNFNRESYLLFTCITTVPSRATSFARKCFVQNRLHLFSRQTLLSGVGI